MKGENNSKFVGKCKWCKSVDWHVAEDYLKRYLFCNECGKVTVYVK